MVLSELTDLVEGEQYFERFLATHATNTIPELVLITLLRDYADLIEQTKLVPRVWHQSLYEHKLSHSQLIHFHPEVTLCR